ncbi:putative UBP type Zn finger protein [Catenulispora sp. GAS73]|uniref:UBP-type zinc finger domain-containing protein n=1 Tax=Catenulispora sp. GAS73 TaxID=3156269 RepID=UPI003514F659
MPIPVYVPANGGRCDHLEQLRDAEPDSTDECRECRATGGRWLSLRECLVCGHVGCCDNSQSRHATAHWRATGHPLIRSLEPGEVWAWCYPDEAMLLPADCY